MDPASVLLGVVPVALGAIKISTSVLKKLKVFKHYVVQVNRIRTMVDVRHQLFVNETHLLLRMAVEDEERIEAMLENDAHPQWASPALESVLREKLQESLEPYTQLLVSVRGALKSIEEELQLMEDRAESDKPTDAAHRLRDRTKIACDTSKLDKHLEYLRGSIYDMRLLRKQLSPEYKEYGTVRKASRAFHQALSLAWSRASGNPTANELRHAVKLFLETQVKDEVTMDVAVLCNGPSLDEDLMGTRLRVRSQNMDWAEIGLATQPAAATEEANGKDRRKRRRTRIGDATAPPPPESRTLQLPITPVPSLSPCSSTTATCRGPSDLLRAQDICSILGCCAPYNATSSTQCLGYIDTCAQDNFKYSFRHSFYRAFKDRSEQDLFQSVRCHNGLLSMDEVLLNPSETSVSFVDQLKLARNLVTAVLKFYSTPWLGDWLSLHDVSFFRLEKDLRGCLQTLHLGFEFVHGTARSNPDSSDMEGLIASSTSIENQSGPSVRQLAVDAENAKLKHGVHNLTLWSLGTMMLQIGMWAKLEQPDDVVAVRKLCSKAPSLSGRYRELTEKCLECNFNSGYDLTKPRLQQAVYEGLVCELNKLIESLDISGD